MQIKAKGNVLVKGNTDAEIVSTLEMISFWGGFDQYTGLVVDQHHPLANRSLSGKIFVVPKGKGSSTGSPILVDAIMSGHAPSAILLKEPDEIMALGGVVCEKFFGKSIPMIVLSEDDFATALVAKKAKIYSDGEIEFYL